MKVAVVGATGLVGGVLLKVLEEFNFPITQLIPVASERSVGKLISFRNQQYPIVSMENAIKQNCALALFSAGGSTSKTFAPLFADKGTVVIDNSSAWRMDPTKKLIVPEVNAEVLTQEDKIIANPNCSTIQMVLTLSPLQKKYGIKRLVISTYQSFTGTGMNAVRQYKVEKEGGKLAEEEMAYPHPIFENCIPHCDVFLDNDYTKEEMKLVHETRKILGDSSIGITATAVRVPVDGGHSESVNVELKESFEIDTIIDLLQSQEGISVLNDPSKNLYPMPLLAKDSNEVFVGRIRKDESLENALNLWIVSDNLRKGAATNAVQIAQYLLHKGMLPNAT